MRKFVDKLYRQFENKPRPKPRYSHRYCLHVQLKIVPNAIIPDRLHTPVHQFRNDFVKKHFTYRNN